MNRIATWIIALMMPAMALASGPTSETTVPATQAASGTPPPNADIAVPGRPCQGIAGDRAGTRGCFGGRWGKGGPPYGAGYEARRKWQGAGAGLGRGVGAGMGRNGDRGAGCGR